MANHGISLTLLNMLIIIIYQSENIFSRADACTGNESCPNGKECVLAPNNTFQCEYIDEDGCRAGYMLEIYDNDSVMYNIIIANNQMNYSETVFKYGLKGSNKNFILKGKDSYVITPVVEGSSFYLLKVNVQVGECAVVHVDCKRLNTETSNYYLDHTEKIKKTIKASITDTTTVEIPRGGYMVEKVVIRFKSTTGRNKDGVLKSNMLWVRNLELLTCVSVEGK